MRITGGMAAGRTIRVPGGAVRPTQDRVREALFSALGARVAGAAVLDLFAGSGALGLEAWSRGAARVCWVERNRRVFAALRGNVAALCGPTADPSFRCLCADARAFLRRNRDPFDLVLADPPYDGAEGGAEGLAKLLRELESGLTLGSQGVLVYEQRANQSPVLRPGWRLARDGRYGDARVLFYARDASPQD